MPTIELKHSILRYIQEINNFNHEGDEWKKWLPEMGCPVDYHDEEKIEINRIFELVKTLPSQSKLILYSIFKLSETIKKLETGEIYEEYKNLCNINNSAILTQRRISDLISELDMLGLINARLISKGRHGRTREIYSTIPSDLKEILMKDLKSELML
mgnify:CR=1 FL=1